ncbi:ABC transporter F family member 4-like isoform X2 [Clytia hemisphaerica]
MNKDTPRRQTRASSRLKEKHVETIEEESFVEDQQNTTLVKKSKSKKDSVEDFPKAIDKVGGTQQEAQIEASPTKKRKTKKDKEKSLEITEIDETQEDAEKETQDSPTKKRKNKKNKENVTEITEAEEMNDTGKNINESPVKKSRKTRKAKEKSPEFVQDDDIQEDTLEEKSPVKKGKKGRKTKEKSLEFVEDDKPDEHTEPQITEESSVKKSRNNKNSKEKKSDAVTSEDIAEEELQIKESPVKKKKRKSPRQDKEQISEITEDDANDKEIEDEPIETKVELNNSPPTDSEDEAPEGISLKDSRKKAIQIQQDISDAKKLKKSHQKQVVQDRQKKNRQQQEKSKKKSHQLPDKISEDVLKLVQQEAEEEQNSDSEMDIDELLNQIGQEKPAFKTQPKNQKITFEDDDDPGFDEQFLDEESEDDLESGLQAPITAQHLYSVDKVKGIGTDAREFLQQHFFGKRLKREKRLKSNFKQKVGSKKSKQIGKRKKII